VHSVFVLNFGTVWCMNYGAWKISMCGVSELNIGTAGYRTGGAHVIWDCIMCAVNMYTMQN
jgi:hypothetical protein